MEQQQEAPMAGIMEAVAAAVAGSAEQPAPAPFIATPDTVKAAEKAALNVHKKINVQAAPIRQYLEATVVPVLMQGLQAVCRERPENPVEYLAYYMLSHNPQKSAGQAPDAAKPAAGSS